MSNDLTTTTGAPNGGAEFSREDLSLVGDAFDSPSILPEAEIDKELKEITALRRTDRREYNKDSALHQRELALLAMKQRWTESNDQGHRWRASAAQILTSMPDADKFEASYDALWANLDEAARDAIRYELALPATQYPARPASQEDIDRFANSDVGTELVKEWAGRAPKKLALLQGRVERLTARTSDEAIAWFESLPLAQAKAVINVMTG
jgi:hypothetical protein